MVSKGDLKVVKTTCLGNNEARKELETFLGRAYQSSHINFLIGSGASTPAIEAAGNVEQDIQQLYESGNSGDIEKANRKKYEFLLGIQNPTNLLLRNEPCCKIARTTANYRRLLNRIAQILHDRNTTLLSKQANIFTTNYDLFIEKAAEYIPNLILNDGFDRTPNLSMRYEFSPQFYFNSTLNTGNLYNYRTEIPTVNLVKMHGSLSWSKNEVRNYEGKAKGNIVFKVGEIESKGTIPSKAEVDEYLSSFALVLPEYHKFRSAVIDRNHYELLRIYANELQRENSLLLVFGFSFEDEHIMYITERALRNASLKIVIFAYSGDAVGSFESKFGGYQNVEIVAPCGDNKIGFAVLGEFLSVRPMVGRKH